MLWLFNPAEPSGGATHPGFDHSGIGVGLSLSVPTFLQLSTQEATGPLPNIPEALGEFILGRVATHTESQLVPPTGRVGTFDRDSQQWATWSASGPLSEAPTWQVSARSFYLDDESGTTILSLGWWAWWGVFSGLDPGLPPIYTGGAIDGGFNPLMGGRFTRRVSLDNFEADNMPSALSLSPWWP